MTKATFYKIEADEELNPYIVKITGMVDGGSVRFIDPSTMPGQIQTMVLIDMETNGYHQSIQSAVMGLGTVALAIKEQAMTANVAVKTIRQLLPENIGNEHRGKLSEALEVAMDLTQKFLDTSAVASQAIREYNDGLLTISS